MTLPADLPPDVAALDERGQGIYREITAMAARAGLDAAQVARVWGALYASIIPGDMSPVPKTVVMATIEAEKIAGERLRASEKKVAGRSFVTDAAGRVTRSTEFNSAAMSKMIGQNTPSDLAFAASVEISPADMISLGLDVNDKLINDVEIQEMVRRIMANPDVTVEQKATLRAGVQGVMDGRMSEWKGMLGTSEISFEHPRRTKLERAQFELMKLAESPTLKIGSVKESATHHISDAFKTGSLIHVCGSEDHHRFEPGEYSFPFEKYQIYLLQHDWAAALSTAEDYKDAGEYILPSEWFALEGRVNGMRFVVDVAPLPEHHEHDSCAAVFFQTKEGWAVLHAFAFIEGHFSALHHATHRMIENMRPVLNYIESQMRAICNALDSELAVTAVTRASHKLNHARERAHKSPVRDFHIVDLSRRRRLAPMPEDHIPGEGAKKKWHYVRGHWRHYEDFKTWIKPHFRGNLDLGVIDKEYRL